MALVSPGVQVTIIDESNYLSAATNSVPYFLIATAQDKVSGSGVGVAAGTLAANANRAYLITSQRDLTATFGNPFFYKTTIVPQSMVTNSMNMAYLPLTLHWV